MIITYICTTVACIDHIQTIVASLTQPKSKLTMIICSVDTLRYKLFLGSYREHLDISFKYQGSPALVFQKMRGRGGG